MMTRPRCRIATIERQEYANVVAFCRRAHQSCRKVQGHQLARHTARFLFIHQVADLDIVGRTYIGYARKVIDAGASLGANGLRGLHCRKESE